MTLGKKTFVRANTTGPWYQEGDIIEVVKKSGNYYQPNESQYIHQNDCEIIEQPAQPSGQGKGMSVQMSNEDLYNLALERFCSPHGNANPETYAFIQGYNLAAAKALLSCPTPESQWPTEEAIENAAKTHFRDLTIIERNQHEEAYNKRMAKSRHDFELGVAWAIQWLRTSGARAGTGEGEEECKECEKHKNLDERRCTQLHINSYEIQQLKECLGELSRCASMVLNIRGSENLDDRIMLMFSNANAEAKSLLGKTI